MLVSEGLDRIRTDLEKFIANKDIEEEKVKNYSEIIETAYKEKAAWALSQKFEPIKSLDIYDSYKLVYDFLCKMQTLLLDAKKRHENPTTAEKILPYINKLTLFTKMLETELHDEEKDIDFGYFENQAKVLREEAKFNELIESVEKVNINFYKLIHETALNTIKNSINI